jgi:hypothetical protein
MGHWALGIGQKKRGFLHLFTKGFYFCLLTYACNIVPRKYQWLTGMGGWGELLTLD